MAEEVPPYPPSNKSVRVPKRYRTLHLQQAKDAGEHFAMLTSYDAMTAGIFDAAGIEVLLVGDSLGNVVLGQGTTLPVTMEDMVTFSKAVVAGSQRSLIIADMPFGSYEESVQQAVHNGVRLIKESNITAVKLEGGLEYVEHIKSLTAAGVPVMAHIGFTPQSENVLGGYRIQGKETNAAEKMVRIATGLQDAGAFAVLMEMVPADVAGAVDRALRVPTVGIGAGNQTTGQVLVWQDAMGLNTGKLPKFVKKYAELAQSLTSGALQYRADVLGGSFPAQEHSF